MYTIKMTNFYHIFHSGIVFHALTLNRKQMRDNCGLQPTQITLNHR